MTNHLEVLSRLNKTPEGVEFLEYLKKLSLDNYNAFKMSDSSFNDIHKGKALAYDQLIKLIEQCDEKLKQQFKKEFTEM